MSIHNNQEEIRWGSGWDEDREWPILLHNGITAHPNMALGFHKPRTLSLARVESMITSQMTYTDFYLERPNMLMHEKKQQQILLLTMMSAERCLWQCSWPMHEKHGTYNVFKYERPNACTAIITLTELITLIFSSSMYQTAVSHRSLHEKSTR